MSVGERIRARRQALGMGVPALARASGLQPSTIYDLENGRSKSTTKLHHIARELGVSVEELETGRAGGRVSESEKDSYARATSHELRIDPDTISAAIKLLRLTFANLGYEWDNEQDGLPLAMAYEHLLRQGQTTVTPENLVDFSKKLAEKLRGASNGEEGRGDAGSAGGGDRLPHRQREAG